MIAYYPFGGSDEVIIVDESGNGHNGEKFNVAAVNDRFSNPARALDFDGTVNSFIRFDDFTDFPVTEISISFWVNSPENGDLISYAVPPPFDNEIHIGNLDELTVNNRRSSTTPIFTDVELNDENDHEDDVFGFHWHHVVMTWNLGFDDGVTIEPSEFKVFKDGIQVFTMTRPVEEAFIDDGTLVFGQDQDCEGGCFDSNTSFSGVLDDIRIYNRILTPLEVLELFDEPNPAIVEIAVDIKPQSCPNPLNVKSKGVLPVAILGTSDLDITEIDLETITLVGVAPTKTSLEDVATPLEPLTGKTDCDDCTTEGSDGFLDLTLKFNTQEIVAAIEADLADSENPPLEDGDCVFLLLESDLLDGTPLEGEDSVAIKKKGK